jgi:hypothetical protein
MAVGLLEQLPLNDEPPLLGYVIHKYGINEKFQKNQLSSDVGSLLLHKTVEIFQTTRCHIPENTPHIIVCENVGTLTICVPDWMNELAMAASLTEDKTYWMNI